MDVTATDYSIRPNFSGRLAYRGLCPETLVMTQATSSRSWRAYRFLGLAGAFYMTLDSVGDQDWFRTVFAAIVMLSASGLAYIDRLDRKRAEASE